jgi:hypothetical protein
MGGENTQHSAKAKGHEKTLRRVKHQQCEVRRPVGEKSIILILRKNRPVQHTSKI